MSMDLHMYLSACKRGLHTLCALVRAVKVC